MATYRPNVAAILRKPASGKILVCQRRDFPECWQFPQGGVDKGEDLLAALYREVEEEVGIARDKYTLQACRTGYRYQFPNGHLKKGQFCGQEQTYFLCDYHGKKKHIVLGGNPPEFQGSKWIDPVEFRLDGIPAFKQEVFRRVFRDFFQIKLNRS